MKTCTYCGKQYSDDLEACPIDNRRLLRPGEQLPAEPPIPSLPPVHPVESTPPEEEKFWEQMTFKKFAALMVRLQAVWLFFYALIDLTYLPSYLNIPMLMGSYSPGYLSIRSGFYMAVLRIGLHIAAAILAIQHAERIISWLIKDYNPKRSTAAHE